MRHLVAEFEEGKVYRSKLYKGDLMLVTRVRELRDAELDVRFVWLGLEGPARIAECYLGQEHSFFFANASSKDMYEEWEL